MGRAEGEGYSDPAPNREPDTGLIPGSWVMIQAAVRHLTY